MTVGTVFTTLILLLRTNTLAYYSLMPQIYSFHSKTNVKLAYLPPYYACIIMLSIEYVSQYLTFVKQFRCKTLVFYNSKYEVLTKLSETK
jgi:hypothetical protein